MDRHIDYAPAPPRYRRKAVRRAIGLALLVAVALPLGWKAGPPAWQRLKLLYWQRQAMSYTPPPDQVVYDEASGFSSFAKPWEHFYQLFSPPGRLPAATLFLHERRNGKGQIRLVAVDGSNGPSVAANPMHFMMSVYVIRPGGAFTQPMVVADASQLINVRSTFSDHVRRYAGQPDPADPSHFTMRCQVKDQSIIIDGWLQDDDTVKLERRR